MYKNLVAALAAACCFSSFAADPLKIGFVYVAPLSDAGWVHQ
ncbi:MAG: BMP family ABC transporter substrate-binding protein, partial [Variovorax sp.]